MWPADLMYVLADDRQRALIRDRQAGRVVRKRRRRR